MEQLFINFRIPFHFLITFSYLSSPCLYDYKTERTPLVVGFCKNHLGKKNPKTKPKEPFFCEVIASKKPIVITQISTLTMFLAQLPRC